MHEVRQHPTAFLGVEAISLKSDRLFPRHSHDQFGVGVISSGGHRSWSDIGWVEAVCGDIIMVNAGEMHDGSCLYDQPRSWEMLFFDPQVVYQVLAEEQWNTIPTLRPTVHDRTLAKRFRSLFDALTAPQVDNFAVEEELVMTLAYAFRHHGSRHPSRVSSMPGVRQIVQLIDREPEKPLSLRTMAEMAGVSRFHLVRGFSRATGTTPHAYILQRRVRLARSLLAAGRDPIDASVDAGFADQSHMTRAFVRQFGISPARYRQAVAGAHRKAISFKTTRGQPCKLET